MKKIEAEARRLEAERQVQKALDALRKAQTDEKEAAVRLSDCNSKKLQIEHDAVERAVKAAAEETVRKKRVAERAALASLPKVPRKA